MICEENIHYAQKVNQDNENYTNNNKEVEYNLFIYLQVHYIARGVDE